MVLIMTKQFPDDQAFDYGQTATSDLSKPPPSDCPRCGSTKMKFCYYNNYNKSQPRHFCKSCKRHWTKDGTLRNIPAGRRRQNKRPALPPPLLQSRGRSISQLSLSLSNDQNDMSDILYQALIRSSSPPQSTILESNDTTYAAGLVSAAAPQNYNTEEFSSFNYVPTSAENLDSKENPTVTTSAAPPWAAMNPSELWNWYEVDLLAILWDHSDEEMITPYKPIFEGYYPR